jgi:hypothetical protein
MLQALEFFFSGDRDDASMLAALRTCLQKEIELLELEATHIQQHLPYYNKMVPLSRQQEADLIKEVLENF